MIMFTLYLPLAVFRFLVKLSIIINNNNYNNFVEVSKYLVLWTNWGHKSKETQIIDKTMYNHAKTTLKLAAINKFTHPKMQV